ncbi:MAG TPA: type II toxin-antitoxin system Phd/YefM family antitoxin [Candidatus Limnocylindrales bacterium]|nr:type II toxin-antitoxin system Phd/YefM family antitoxin [Candidatus Limnocylindrales bacterium]
MPPVNIHEAKTTFSKLLQRVAAGEEITIANRGVPVARLIPVRTKRGKRQLGFDSGRGRIADDFDAPLPPHILAGFFGGPPKRRAKQKKR